MQRVNKALYAFLAKWTPEGTSVYPVVADEDAVYPYCVFSCDSLLTKRTKDGIYSYVYQYSVDIWGCTFNQSDRVATSVMAASEEDGEVRFDNPTGKLTATLTGAETAYSDGGFVQRLTYEVKYEGEVV